MSQERRTTLSIGVAVFLSGAVLLGVEIAASRVLAPTFGSSLYVWGSLIGIVLTGLAVGYWVGGVAADRMPSPYLLVSVLAVGAVLVALVPVLDEAVLTGIVEWDPGPRLDPLLAAAILFGPLSIVLASASPIAVRLAASSLQRLGRTAGRLFSISTAGSIFGTFVTAFWLVPEHRHGSGARNRGRHARGGGAGRHARPTPSLGLVRPRRSSRGRRRCSSSRSRHRGRGSSEASRRRTGRRSTASGSSARRARSIRRQSGRSESSSRCAPPATRNTTEWSSQTTATRATSASTALSRAACGSTTRTARGSGTPIISNLGLAHRPASRDVLFIGLGGGSSPKRMWRDFPRLRLQAVELDPEVVEAAYRWFELPRDPRLAVDVDDGRRWLTRHEKRWDVIVIDAFYADAIPFHLATREFLQLVRQRLAPDGVVVVNVIGSVTGSESKLLRSLTKTYGSSFSTVLLYPVYDGAGDRNPTYTRNVILVATDAAAPSTSFLREHAGRRSGRPRLGRRASTRRSPTAGGTPCAWTTCRC